MPAGRAAALLLAGLSACGPARAPGYDSIPVAHQGSYRFLERVPGSSPQIIVEGEFTVRADTILVGVTNGNCQGTAVRDTRSFSYRCGEVSLYFARENPARSPGYSVRGTAVEVKTVCKRSGTDSSGRPVCLEYGPQRNEVRRTFAGRLRPIPLP